jgi:WD40 repeat protein
MSIAMDGSGRALATGGADGSIRVADIATGKEVYRCGAHVKPVRGLAFSSSSDGHQSELLLAASDDGHISVYEMKSGAQVASIAAHTPTSSWALTVAMSPSGNQIASGGSDRRVKLWDWRTRECLHTFEGHRDSIWSLAYSPDGKNLASVGDDAALQFYDIDSK